ncbi:MULTISPECIES: hypothetical protein [unclassified Streptomyces]|uniref:hypothetical protein n=1 Tax=unclassified Streptomyces TaxID=2593676 RepID=UPI0006AEA07B|nr:MULTISPECIES: hypothetical protein [unclassified Streptomyces]KOX25479.1 hypothetical protein ADL06_19165 [Streptomyces sp. NRRL F-6491]KOX42106.1 hypothetical protein ADL08_17290 [Streptomyces sp. NRRL F-6492]
MSASENNNESRSRWSGPHTASDGTGNGGGTGRGPAAAGKAAKGSGETGDAVGGTLAMLPAPLAEKTLAAVHAVRGTGGLVWTAVRTRKALASGTAAVGAAALTGAYALGRRTGTRSRGPLTRLTGGRI